VEDLFDGWTALLVPLEDIVTALGRRLPLSDAILSGETGKIVLGTTSH
jgi:hypothetical protein